MGDQELGKEAASSDISALLGWARRADVQQALAYVCLSSPGRITGRQWPRCSPASSCAISRRWGCSSSQRTTRSSVAKAGGALALLAALHLHITVGFTICWAAPLQSCCRRRSLTRAQPSSCIAQRPRQIYGKGGKLERVQRAAARAAADSSGDAERREAQVLCLRLFDRRLLQPTAAVAAKDFHAGWVCKAWLREVVWSLHFRKI